ncbi:MAG: tRNA (guanosine(46)-N7)-methyltransferase TrmB [Phycisphaerae bacterium]|nr:tRNA (guanosine(46)-N7)-methyltransferase TrmB [Phycisphaerae bacterium]
MADVDHADRLTFDAIAVPLESLGKPADLRALFGNDHPVELEIGCGKGGFLLRMAEKCAERNFLGIEWANKYYKFAADRMARWGMANVRLIRTDAKNFVMHRLAPGCLSALHVYHPDPWPKKRHHRRRLFTPDFVEAAVRVLAQGARLAIQTDHAGYFEQIRSVTFARQELAQVCFDDAEFGTVNERTETNFEIKYMREGRLIYRLAFKRVR